MSASGPRHVGLNLVFMVPGTTGGMEVAARALIPALRDAAPGIRLTAFVNREAAAEDLGVESVVVPVNAARRVEWVRGEQQLLPGLARRAGCDLVHSLASTAPARGRFVRVVTIHDLNYLTVPDAHFGLRSVGMRLLVPLAARTSHRVIADSGATRDDIVTRLRVPAGKVDVVPLGLGRPATLPTPPDELRERLALARRPVLLSLSAKRPHKNLGGLIEALSRIQRERRPVLVLPGYPTPHEAELRDRAAALGLSDDVRFLGWTSEADIEGLFALCGAFVFPSFYEGFGLPVLEAMARGVPVACSDRASLPEVAGDAALLFDPSDPAAIAAALERLLGDPVLAERLRVAGCARAAAFTWERTAQLTLASYERALATASAE
jgi:glycosyltransferase involved in cell wall biosynthesis